jgi:phosphoribosylamine--glycine ligase
MASIAVLASGRGSTLAYLVEGAASGALKAEISMVVVDRPATGAAAIAEKASIPLLLLDRKEGSSVLSRKIAEALDGKVDLIVCAGFLSILTDPLLKAFRGRIVNIHPSLLPDFGGMGMHGVHVHRAVIESGCRCSGCSVHLVDDGIDSGRVLARRRVPVFPGDTPEILASRVGEEEKPLLLETINALLAGEEHPAAAKIRAAVIGKGGREHALCWKLLQDDDICSLAALPGNGGTALLEGCDNIPMPKDEDSLIDLLRGRGVNLVVVGPEVPLVEGLGMRLRKAGFAVFGPDSEGARLEGSKAFAKNFMIRHGVATADYQVFLAGEQEKALGYAASLDWRVAVKADGLAAGKGVLLCSSREEVEKALDTCFGGGFGDAGRTVVIEELLTGPEVSFFALTDGIDYLLLPSARDHKRALDGDRGLNTGGMGSVAPAPGLSSDIEEAFTKAILLPTLRGLREDAILFRGVLFFGMMLTSKGPKLLEYNVRFGDPETQSLMPLLPSDFARLLFDCARGNLPASLAADREKERLHACTVVAVAEGYPESAKRGDLISLLPPASDHSVSFVSGAELRPDGSLVTAGGRVLSLTAWGDDAAAARMAAYDLVQRVSFRGMHFRSDIGLF